MARIMGSDVEFIDVEGLFERSGESSRRTILILRSFLGCYQELLTQLENDADSLSTEELGKLAHAIKGLAGEVGAKSLHKLAHALEKFGKGDRREDLMRGVPELISEIKQAAAIVWRIVQAFDGSGERIAVDSHPPA
jgi:HPt (histidine-containing phosphotransfer) domain-containing protein